MTNEVHTTNVEAADQRANRLHARQAGVGMRRSLVIRHSSFVVACLLCLVPFMACGVTWADVEQPPGPTILQEPPRLLAPRRSRSEADHDQLTAAAHFAYGRLLMHRGNHSQALRRFQRAWRYDPQAGSIIREIVPLARRLRRNDETARYAVIAAELRPEDPQLLTQLGALLVEQRNLSRALSLFSKALPLFEKQEQQLQAVALRVEMGRLYFLVGQHEQAATTLAAAVEVLDDPARAGITQQQRKQLIRKPELLYKLLAEAYLEVGRHDEAERSFRKTDSLQSNEAVLAINLARVDLARGNLPRAGEQLSRYFQSKQSTGGALPYELLKQLLLKKHEDETQAQQLLLQRLGELYDEDVDNAVLGYHFAAQLREAKRWSAAEEIYLDLLLSRPATQAFQGLTEIYHRQKKTRELIEILADTWNKSGSTQAIARQIAVITEDQPFLIQLLDLVVHEAQNSPESVSQAVRMGTALMAVAGGQFEKSETLYQLALTAEGLPKHEVMRRIALAMFFADRASRAAEIFQEAIDQQPGSEFLATYYYYLAGALELADQTDQAVRAAEKAASLDNSIRFQTRPAWVLYHAKRYDEAEKRYQELVQRFDEEYDSPATRLALRDIRLVLSNLCVLQDRLATAEEWLEQVLDEFPEDVGASNDLGYLWADRGEHLRRALSMIRRAVKAAPENAAYRDSLGWAYFRSGQYGEAVRELEQATDNANPDGVILDHLGDAYLQLGKKQKALEAWRRAVKAMDSDVDTKVRKAAREKIKQHQVGTETRDSSDKVPN